MDINQDSLIKWQISEQAVEDYGHLHSEIVKNFVRHSPTGVNSPNADFTFTVRTQSFIAELKNHFQPLVVEYVLDNILPKFIEMQTKMKQNSRWVLIVPRMYRPAKDLCKSLGIEIVEFQKQLVSEKQWNDYDLTKRRHSSPKTTQLLKALDQYLFGEGSKVSSISYLDSNSLSVQDYRGDFLFVMKNGKIDQSFPFLHILKICDHCGELFQARDYKHRFCSMKCFHEWGGPSRIVRNRN